MQIVEMLECCNRLHNREHAQIGASLALKQINPACSESEHQSKMWTWTKLIYHVAKRGDVPYKPLQDPPADCHH